MNKINKINKLNKMLYCIRHGQAQHNVNYLKHGSQTFYDSKYIDTRLTFIGISESIKLRDTWSDLKKIDLVITSPLFRALQTTMNLFKNKILDVPIISLECVREFPNSKQTCNKRSNKSELKRIFPYINFENLKSEHDNIWNPNKEENIDELNLRITEFNNFLSTRKEKNIRLIGHGSFIGQYKDKKINFLDNGDKEFIKLL